MSITICKTNGSSPLWLQTGNLHGEVCSPGLTTITMANPLCLSLDPTPNLISPLQGPSSCWPGHGDLSLGQSLVLLFFHPFCSWFSESPAHIPVPHPPRPPPTEGPIGLRSERVPGRSSAPSEDCLRSYTRHVAFDVALEQQLILSDLRDKRLGRAVRAPLAQGEAVLSTARAGQNGDVQGGWFVEGSCYWALELLIGLLLITPKICG